MRLLAGLLFLVTDTDPFLQVLFVGKGLWNKHFTRMIKLGNLAEESRLVMTT